MADENRDFVYFRLFFLHLLHPLFKINDFIKKHLRVELQILLKTWFNSIVYLHSKFYFFFIHRYYVGSHKKSTNIQLINIVS